MTLHFVHFRGEEYHAAVKVFGKPDFYHMVYDKRAQKEFAEGDMVVFAQGTEKDMPFPYTYDDSNFF